MPLSADKLGDIKEALTAPQRFAARLYHGVRWFFRVFISGGERFYWDNGFSKAASLAYSTLFSLVPLTVVALGLLASFLSQIDIDKIRGFIFQQFVPSMQAANTVLEWLNKLTGVIGNPVVIIFFVVTSLLLINAIEYALNEVWQVYEPRTIAQRVSIFCAIIVIAPVFALSAYYTATFDVTGLLAEVGFGQGYLVSLYTWALPLLIDFLAFVLLYYLVPKAPVQLSSAVFGAMAAAVLFDIAKRLFAIYIVSSPFYEAIYQALAAIPIFLFWIYVSWVIVLFGAEVSYQAQYLPPNGKLWTRSVTSIGDGLMVLAMQALIIVTRSFTEGKRLPNELELAEKLGCSSVVLKPALEALKRAGIVSQGDGRDMPITLRRAPDKITLEQIREALYKGRASFHYPQDIARVFSRAVEGRTGLETSLADIVKS